MMGEEKGGVPPFNNLCAERKGEKKGGGENVTERPHR